VKKLIAPIDRVAVYNYLGNMIGYEVQEVDGYTEKELRDTGALCSECGKANGNHGDYFIKTGQDGLGSVDGYYKDCGRKGR